MALLTWFEVTVVSDDLKKILRHAPEAASAEYIIMDNIKIDGPKEILSADTIDEVKSKLPDIIANLDASYPNIRIVYKSTPCQICIAEKEKNPQKLIHSCVRDTNSWYVDVKKFFKTQNIM